MNLMEFTLCAILIFFVGVFAGADAHEKVIIKEAEQYKSIRINGVYYYPERSGDNDK